MVYSWIVKTTLDISDQVLREIKELSARQGLPMRETVERALRQFLAGAPSKQPFRLKTITTAGEGLVKPRSWEEIRGLIYEGQGGEPSE